MPPTLTTPESTIMGNGTRIALVSGFLKVREGGRFSPFPFRKA